MVKELIDLLMLDDYYGVSNNVDIAKGKNQKPTTWKELWKYIKRIYYGQKGNS